MVNKNTRRKKRHERERKKEDATITEPTRGSFCLATLVQRDDVLLFTASVVRASVFSKNKCKNKNKKRRKRRRRGRRSHGVQRGKAERRCVRKTNAEEENDVGNGDGGEETTTERGRKKRRGSFSCVFS